MLIFFLYDRTGDFLNFVINKIQVVFVRNKIPVHHNVITYYDMYTYFMLQFKQGKVKMHLHHQTDCCILKVQQLVVNILGKGWVGWMHQNGCNLI